MKSMIFGRNMKILLKLFLTKPMTATLRPTAKKVALRVTMKWWDWWSTITKMKSDFDAVLSITQ